MNGRIGRSWVVSLVLLCAVGGPAGAREAAGGSPVAEASIGELIAGSAVPLTMKLKEFSPEWRRVSITGEAMLGMGGVMQSMMQSMGSIFGGGKLADALYTRGATLRMGSEQFLIGYRLPAPGMDFASLMGAAMAAGAGGKGAPPPRPEAHTVTPETELSLVLVNVKSIASIGEIRPFSMAEVMQAQAGGFVEMLMREAAKEAATKEAAAKAAAAKPKPAPAAKPAPKR